MRPPLLILAILDGWGYREESDHNAIAAARTPAWDALWRDCPHSLLDASESHVGLPAGQMGNSEVGHMNIGAGRVILQDLPRIDATIRDGSLARNPKLLAFIAALKRSGGACHLLGLLSDGGVHAHGAHMAALAEIISGAGVPVRVHAFLDGRDTPPRSAERYVATWENHGFATLSGRYYAMDRDKRWERVQKAYDAIVLGEGERMPSTAEAVRASYARGVSDEFVLPAVIGGYAGMKDGDGLLMANFRADRARQILRALLDPAFDGFTRKRQIRFAAALGMTEYAEDLAAWMPALFPPESPRATFGEIIATAGLTQLRIAETEKYAHVTFFFNGGREETFPGEERILIPSPKVATYDLKPEMSAFEMTDRLVEAVDSGKYDVMIVNYANADMVGHTGSMAAAVKAVEAVDACLERLRAAVEKRGGVLAITADHGNVEMLHDHATEQAHTAHTLSKVPFVLAGAGMTAASARLEDGRLADIAPTLLALLGLPQSVEMTGRNLMRRL